MDLRIENIFTEEMKGDTSFKGQGFTLFPNKYSQNDMREVWNNGIKHGIEIGLRKSSLAGQRIELSVNTTDPISEEFIEKFYKLAGEYNCAIQYHPEKGMCLVKLNSQL